LSLVGRPRGTVNAGSPCPSPSGTIHQLAVVTAMAGGVALFGERLDPGEALGCLLTMTGVAWSVVAGTRPALARAPQRR
jgi:drug/metabolite transporter (DMT)-like permease